MLFMFCSLLIMLLYILQGSKQKVFEYGCSICGPKLHLDVQVVYKMRCMMSKGISFQKTIVSEQLKNIFSTVR